jgi:hypothetical protein
MAKIIPKHLHGILLQFIGDSVDRLRVKRSICAATAAAVSISAYIIFIVSLSNYEKYVWALLVQPTVIVIAVAIIALYAAIGYFWEAHNRRVDNDGAYYQVLIAPPLSDSVVGSAPRLRRKGLSSLRTVVGKGAEANLLKQVGSSRMPSLVYRTQRDAETRLTIANAREAIASSSVHRAVVSSAKANDIERLGHLLSSFSINVNDVVEPSNGWTALHYAAYYSKYDLVQLLLEYGGDPTIIDTEGLSVCDVAQLGFRDQRIRDLLMQSFLAHSHVTTNNRTQAEPNIA